MDDLSDILGAGWGPTEDAIPSFSGLPFAPFSKHDNITYVANWDPSTYRGRPRRRRPQSQYGADEAGGLAAMSDNDENEDGFDDMITVKKRDYHVIAKYRRDRTNQAEKLNYSQGKKVVKEQKRLQEAPTSRRATRRQQQNKKRWRKPVENPRPIRVSVVKKDTWSDMNPIWFRDNFEEGYGNNKSFTFKIDGEETFNRVYTPIPKRLRLAGRLNGILTKYDMQSGNTYKPTVLDFDRYSDFKYCNMNWKSAIQDPYILELATSKESNANIFTTENVLSAIMCCTRSRYSFDIVINKIGNKIFLDERNKGLSHDQVDETSQNRPTKKNQNRGIDGYWRLANEATYISHVFGEQMLYHNNLQHMQKFKWNHPFETNTQQKGKKGGKGVIGGEPGQQVASQAFSYNLYHVTDDIRVICRTAIDGFITKTERGKPPQREWARVFALNQYNCSKSKTKPWIKCLSHHEASIMKQEIANNNFKCARWAMKAHLSGCGYMKVGFVTRSNMHSTDKHLITGVKTYETRDFIRHKLHIHMEEPWTVFAKFMKCITEQIKDDGRYVALRDPLKQVIHLYQCDKGAFVAEQQMPSWKNIKKLLGQRDDDD